MTVREKIMAAGLAAFDERGFDRVTVAEVRAMAGVSNGSFFHYFPTREDLAAALYLDALSRYHRAMAAALDDDPRAAEGIAALICAHLGFVKEARPHARFLFEQVRGHWLDRVRPDQHALNQAMLVKLGAWHQRRVAAGELRALALDGFVAQVIGPAQIFCRAYLAGTGGLVPPTLAPDLIESALRALSP